MRIDGRKRSRLFVRRMDREGHSEVRFFLGMGSTLGPGPVIVTGDIGAVLVGGDRLDWSGRLSPRRKPCDLRVTLKHIVFAGDNIGSEWKFEISVNGLAPWRSGVVDSGSLAQRDLADFSVQEEGGCGVPQPVSIWIRATETSGWFNDVGEINFLLLAPCTETAFQQDVVVPLAVVEGPAWMRRIRKLPRRVAFLVFIFVLSTKCAG